MTDRVHQHTVDEFDRIAMLPENLGKRLQLINGEIVEEMPKIIHARIMRLLMKWLERHMDEYSAGEIFPEIRIDLPNKPDNARVADIGIVVARRDELAKLNDHDALPFMPDLIIEIQSEGQTDHYMRDLANFYLTNGCRMVWLVYPDRKQVEVHRTRKAIEILGLDGILNGDRILPGFKLAVSDLLDS